MRNTDPRVDAYIEQAAPFAQPILRHIRAVVHEACPDVHETIKWNVPSFEHHGIMAGMAAFKTYCHFAFWKSQLLANQFPTLAKDGEALGRLGGIATVKDFPSRGVLVKVVRAAAKLNEDGVKLALRPSRGPVQGSACSRGPPRGTQEQCRRPAWVRVVESQSQARIHRVDHGGQARRDP